MRFSVGLLNLYLYYWVFSGPQDGDVDHIVPRLSFCIYAQEAVETE